MIARAVLVGMLVSASMPTFSVAQEQRDGMVDVSELLTQGYEPFGVSPAGGGAAFGMYGSDGIYLCFLSDGQDDEGWRGRMNRSMHGGGGPAPTVQTACVKAE